MLCQYQNPNSQNSGQHRQNDRGFVGTHHPFACLQVLLQPFGHKDTVINSQSENKSGDDDIENIEMDIE